MRLTVPFSLTFFSVTLIKPNGNLVCRNSWSSVPHHPPPSSNPGQFRKMRQGLVGKRGESAHLGAFRVIPHGVGGTCCPPAGQRDSGNGPAGPTDFLQAARAINFVLLEEAPPVHPPPCCTLSPLPGCPVCHTHWFYGLPSCLSHTLASRTAVPSVTHWFHGLARVLC